MNNLPAYADEKVSQRFDEGLLKLLGISLESISNHILSLALVHKPMLSKLLKIEDQLNERMTKIWIKA